MKRQDSLTLRVGFTIIELLVVIGILGILLAALLPMVGGSRDSALNAKCQNNMKNLALGVITYAQGHSDHGHFPAAGLYRSVDPTSKRTSYWPHRPWISNNGSPSQLNNSQPSVLLGDVVHFSDAEDAVRMALTNGAIWVAAGSSYEVYRCPVHAREYEKKHSGRQPGWSYMMNQEFGFNRDGAGKYAFFGSSINGSITVSTESSGRRDRKTDKKASRGHDKVLLLAEIQGIDVNEKGVSLKAATSGSQTDAVLEYTQESMGFNHPIGKHRWGGNVAFADGHVDSVILPTSMDSKELTRYLCQGFDVPHDGRTYKPSAVDE